MSTALLILTWNEVEAARVIFPKIKKEWVDEILVVDGGSTDGTIEEAKKVGFNIIKQEIKGHGGAIITGINNTKSENIIIFGPDGNHEPEEIPRLIKKIDEGFDQVVVSRFTKESVIKEPNYGFVKFGNQFFTFFVNLLFGGNLSDTMTDSRIITRKAFEELNFDVLLLDSTLTMSIRGMKKKQKMTEIVGDQGERIGGQRKMKPIKTGMLLIRRIIKEL
jgi:glycosyltransferase involved in cell wall biosynthesis